MLIIYNAEWDLLKQEKAKQRFTVSATEMTAFDQMFNREQTYMRRQIALLESRLWFKKRKLCPRERPLGVDALGNTYWLFIQRDKNAEDWGRWIVIEKAKELPHPSGVLPPNLAPPPQEEGGEENAEQEEVVQVPDEERKKRVWFAISTSEEANALAKWVSYTAEMVFYERTMKPLMMLAQHPNNINNASSSSSSTPHIDPLTSPTRQRLQAVQVPLSPNMRNLMKSDPEEAKKLFVVAEPDKVDRRESLTRKEVEDLVGGIKKVAGFWRLEEEGVDGEKLAV